MKLLQTIGAPDDLSDGDSFPWLWAYLATCDPTRSDFIDDQIVELALTLAERGQFGIADAGVIELSGRLEITLDRFLQISLRLCEAHVEFFSTRLFSYYLSRGGADRMAYEYEIYRNYNLDALEKVISLFQSSQRWFAWKTFSQETLFTVSSAFIRASDNDSAFNILNYLIEEYPDITHYTKNLSFIALTLRDEQSRVILRRISQSIAESFVHNSDTYDAPPALIVDTKDVDERAIVRALEYYGLCHIKNGVDPAVASDVLIHLFEFDKIEFPTGLTPYIIDQCQNLLRFDASAVVDAVLPKPGAIDVAASSIRKVDPGQAGSFTPFHQDTTAFQKAVVNIWTPLTPAGGDYPTMEFVKRKLTSAEDTTEGADEYHRVRIDDKLVLEKFGDELYEPNDVKPGDCIIFLGTTIHRSTNLRGATKPRYSLEIRWS